MEQGKLICDRGGVFPGEFVLCDSEQAVAAHRELFNIDSKQYIICEDKPFECLSSFRGECHKLHIATSWEGMLGIALWQPQVAIEDAIYVLKNAGMSYSELSPFKDGRPEDIFPVLYYGKNFDMLRKVCNIAKRMAESSLKRKFSRIDCHLVSDESNRIIASSL
ncbi:MAG: hypothetical protein BV458_06495 [Thermoplasmata archaeon M9B2D]|nr:MAG: hypothetical protein BV458_06495 [Thermoplasmata archaeon M9B2D]